MHIELDDELVRKVDEVAGPRGRSAFMRSALEEALTQALRWHALEEAAGSLADADHEWDADTAAWVRDQRHDDPRRVG